MWRAGDESRFGKSNIIWTWTGHGRRPLPACSGEVRLVVLLTMQIATTHLQSSNRRCGVFDFHLDLIAQLVPPEVEDLERRLTLTLPYLTPYRT